MPEQTNQELQNKGVRRNFANCEDFVIADSVRASLAKIDPKKSEANRKKYHLLSSACRIKEKYGLKQKVANSLGMGGKTRQHKIQLQDIQRKKRKDRIDQETQKLVKEFWCSEGISREVPLKKQVKQGIPANLLECTYIEAYTQFKKSHSGIKIGFTAFIGLKPKYVRHMKAMERQVCCCKKCENVKLKIKAINKLAKQSSLNIEINGKNGASDDTLCSYDTNFPARKCLDRKCENCGTHLIATKCAPLIEKIGKQHQTTYDEWQQVKHEYQGKTISRTQLITNQCTLEKLVEELVCELTDFSGHLFRALWQQNQFSFIKENMPPKSCVVVIDFAENYTCSLQDEVQSHHWGSNR